MPESVTGFQLLEKPDNLLIIMHQSGATFAVLPTKIREEPIFWVCTANSVDALPAPVLDRLLVVPIEPPSDAERRVIVKSVCDKFVAEQPGTRVRLDEEALAALTEHTPRMIAKLLLLARGFAAARGSTWISGEDIERARAIVIPNEKSRRYGFL
jgi:DNA helicase TIP49 (TBP-interacting protein)